MATDKDFSIKGTGVALVTPMNKSGEIDLSSLGKLIDNVIKNGCDYIVCLGTTSEYPTLNDKETNAIINYTKECVDSRIPIVIGIGGNDTWETVNRITNFDFDGISAVLSVSPYYNKPNQNGIYEHFARVSASSPVPMIIYNVPSRTGGNITAETTLKLANDCKNIIGIKEASGNMQQCMEILRQKPNGFELVSGEDALTLPLIAMGAKGVISVSANAFPKLVSDMVNFALRDSCKKAIPIHNKLLPFTNAIFEEGNPTGIKTALKILGITEDYVRLPLVKASKQLYNKINGIIKKM